MSSTSTARPAPRTVSRRAIVRAAAWSVPVVAIGSAAPWAAASPCAPQHYTLDWGGLSGSTYTRTSSTAGLATVDPDGAGPIRPVTLTVASTFTGTMASGNETRGLADRNYVVSDGQVGGTGRPGLQFEQVHTNRMSSTPPGRDARQTVTFTFSEPVVNLAFTITDIDALGGDFVDVVELSGPFTYQHQTTRTTGAGTQANPFTNTQYGDVSSSQALGNVRVAYAGPVTSFQMTYWNAVGSYSGVDRNQIVSFGTFDFDVLRTNC